MLVTATAACLALAGRSSGITTMSHSTMWRSAGLGALVALVTVPAFAADLAYPPYPGIEPGPSRVYRGERIEEPLPPPPPPRPVYGPRFVGGSYAPPPPPGEECRVVVKHRIDAYGEEVERRVRICEEEPGPRYRPSFYRPPHPVPPADIPGDRWDAPPRW
jgi:hypothetical protein